MKRKAFLAIAASVAAVATASSSSTAQQRPRSLSQSAVAQAAQQHPAIVAEFGGEESGARAAYVRSVGARVTGHTSVAGGATAYRITTLNSPVMNAFAVPGGYLYITRQLLGLMNDEAELASVLGHEAGHIAARHSRERRRTGLLSQLGALVVGVVTGSGQLAQIAGQAGQVWALSYSRRQEFEADQLGVRYMAAAGYDPDAAASMLNSLGAWSALEARFQGREDNQRATPSWARTHPLSADRVRRATQHAQATGRAGAGIRNREQHLAAINGMYFDDDPAQGIVEGREFLHPDLRLAFTVPQGFGIQNGGRAVAVVGQTGQAQFSTGPFNGNLRTYVGQVFQALGGQQQQIRYSEPQSTTINGIPAAYSTARVQTQQGVVDVTVVAYQFESNRAYHFAMITPAGRGLGTFDSMVQSVRRLTPQQAAAIRPRRVQIHTVRAGDTVQTLAARMAYTSFQTERFLTLNGLSGNNAAVR
ncbi:M48 family metalloprotease, partial [Allosphingosinicella sp.]|uniref:M48 family metalloprotease n=1 Tax=Allosphingosinicella sp. TaxID=2823234 RepID=UPI002EEA98D7